VRVVGRNVRKHQEQGTHTIIVILEIAAAAIIIVIILATQNNPDNSRVLLKIPPETTITRCAIWLKAGRRKEEVRGGGR
jgi:hypothetical protein